MTEAEFLDKKRWHELRIRAQVRAGRYAAIKAHLREPSTEPKLPFWRLRVIAREHE